MKKMYPDFFTRMVWKRRTGLPMNVAIDDGYAYDFQQLPFIQVEDAFWMTIADAPETIGPLEVELSAQDIDYLKNFIVRNKVVLLVHWNGEIGSEEVARGLAF